MKRTYIILFTLILSFALNAQDFVSQLMKLSVDEERPLTNINIGKAMLEKMSTNTEDSELKEAFSELNSIRIVSSEETNDSKFFYVKANEIIQDSFIDYEEVVSVNDTFSKISMYIKKRNEDNQDLILISLDDKSKLTIITVSGKIDFSSMSKLSGSLKAGQLETEPIIE